MEHIIWWGEDMYSVYQVQSGDTLASVASEFGVSPEMLSNLNGIMVGSILTPGEVIVVPNKILENPYFREYTVKKGDNIYEIAKANNIDFSQLLRLNGLNDTDIIYPGQKIMLPKKDVLFYITLENDTFDDLMKFFKVNADEIVKENGTIYLVNDQLFVHKK